MPKAKVFVSFFVLIVVGYFYLPFLIHNLKSKATEKSEVTFNLAYYNKISLKKNELYGKTKSKELVYALDSLYLWLHVRGISIDEDHKSISTYDKWKEIIDYHFSK